jgi:tRNA nucleotidyltransferase (CCA-adding enzyme)
MTTQQQFLDFLWEIEPSASTVSACSAAHSTLRSALRDDPNFSQSHVNTFLTGSYKRDTAIRPRMIDGVLQRPDVDIIVVTNHSEEDRPKDVLDLLHAALKDAGYDDLKMNRRSIAVTLASVDMDVVPVIEDGDALLIPDVELKGWVPTNPQAHTQWTVDVNASMEGRFKPLVKLTKWWRREHLADLRRPKGFILECLVAKHMGYYEKNYETLLVGLLEAIRDNYASDVESGQVPFIEDPAVPGSNVFSNVTAAEFKKFYNKAKEHASLARKAKNESDSAEALKLWRQILGPRFPAAASQKTAANSLLRPAAGAGLTFPASPVLPNKPSGFA